MAGARSRTISSEHCTWSSIRLLTSCAGGSLSCRGPSSCLQASVTLPAQDILDDCERTSGPPRKLSVALLSVPKQLSPSRGAFRRLVLALVSLAMTPFLAPRPAARHARIRTSILSARDWRRRNLALHFWCSRDSGGCTGSEPGLATPPVEPALVGEMLRCALRLRSQSPNGAPVKQLASTGMGAVGTAHSSVSAPTSGSGARQSPTTTCTGPRKTAEDCATVEMCTAALMRDLPVSAVSEPSSLTCRTCATGGMRRSPRPATSESTGHGTAPCDWKESACRNTFFTCAPKRCWSKSAMSSLTLWPKTALPRQLSSAAESPACSGGKKHAPSLSATHGTTKSKLPLSRDMKARLTLRMRPMRPNRDSFCSVVRMAQKVRLISTLQEKPAHV
mmetsp:Transcript_87137/g.247051  ORF Transcript_87137/g.247051 Transcript_87137/m.247051 type:complete len:391 (+) Transcript_87137:316-1488(+)